MFASAVGEAVSHRPRPSDSHTDSRTLPSELTAGKSSPSKFPAAGAEPQPSTSTSSRDTRRRTTLAGPAAIRILRRKRFEELRPLGPVGSSHGDLGSCRRTDLPGEAGVLLGIPKSMESGRSGGPGGDGGDVRDAAVAAVGADQTWGEMDLGFRKRL